MKLLAAVVIPHSDRNPIVNAADSFHGGLLHNGSLAPRAFNVAAPTVTASGVALTGGPFFSGTGSGFLISTPAPTVTLTAHDSGHAYGDPLANDWLWHNPATTNFILGDTLADFNDTLYASAVPPFPPLPGGAHYDAASYVISAADRKSVV